MDRRYYKYNNNKEKTSIIGNIWLFFQVIISFILIAIWFCIKFVLKFIKNVASNVFYQVIAFFVVLILIYLFGFTMVDWFVAQ